MPADASLLTDIPLFAALRAKERRLLADAVDHRSVSAGETLFKSGDPGQSMFVVASGEIEIFVTDHAGQKIVLATCSRGDAFGELAMLDEGPRSATATARTDSDLLEIDRDDLLLLVRKSPDAALHLLGAMGAMTRKADHLLRARVARNVQDEIEDARTPLEKVTDWVAAFSGSMPFLLFNAVWFALWIWLNVSGISHFDPYPFGFLTMVVSLEAIILSILVLLAQNRQAAKDHIRDDVEYGINVKAELEVVHLHEKLDATRVDLLARLARIEERLPPPQSR